MNLRKVICLCLIGSLLANMAACGTILHPERKGQRDGRIDAGIAVLDGVGLLFFLIPGVIAFAVDFSNGTIYLPGGRHSSLNSPLRVVHAGHDIDAHDVEQVLADEMHIKARLDDPAVSAHKAASLDEVQDRIALLPQS